jgi:hypothetical protein
VHITFHLFAPSAARSITSLLDNMFSITVILLLLPFFRCSAFPTQAGSCQKGKNAFKNSYGQNGAHMGADVEQIGGSAIGNAGFELYIDGHQVYPNKLFQFTAGEEHTIKLMATGDIMKGFLMRLESVDGQDTIDSLYSSDGKVQTAFSCTNQEFVGGLSHVNNNAKTMIEGTLYMAKTSDLLLLDVTTVVSMLYYLHRSEFYTSEFRLQAVSKGTSITYETGTTTTTPVSTQCLSNGEGCSKDGSCCSGRCIREYTQNVYAQGFCQSSTGSNPAPSPTYKAPPAPSSASGGRPKGSSCNYSNDCQSKRCTNNVCASVPSGGGTRTRLSGNRGGGSNRAKRMLRKKQPVTDYFTTGDLASSLVDVLRSLLAQ